MTTEPRHFSADMEAAEALHRRTTLGWMLEDKSRVRVSNPYGGAWTGRIIALADHPAMLLERDDGRRVMLPQCFAVEEVAGEAREPREDEDRRTSREHLAWLMWCYEQGYANPAARADLTNWMGNDPATLHPCDVERQRDLLGMADEVLALLAEAEREGREKSPSVKLLEEALHLRMNGERAPGGNETWHDWDLRAETFLRSLLPEPDAAP